MKYGNYQQGRFIRRICDEVLSHSSEAQRPGTQIGTLVPLMGKRYQATDGGQDLFA
jgi:hypothetical protein